MIRAARMGQGATLGRSRRPDPAREVLAAAEGTGPDRAAG